MALLTTFLSEDLNSFCLSHSCSQSQLPHRNSLVWKNNGNFFLIKRIPTYYARAIKTVQVMAYLSQKFQCNWRKKWCTQNLEQLNGRLCASGYWGNRWDRHLIIMLFLFPFQRVLLLFQSLCAGVVIETAY